MKFLILSAQTKKRTIKVRLKSRQICAALFWNTSKVEGADRLRPLLKSLDACDQLNGSLICGVSRAAGLSLGFSGAFSGARPLL